MIARCICRMVLLGSGALFLAGAAVAGQGMAQQQNMGQQPNMPNPIPGNQVPGTMGSDTNSSANLQAEADQQFVRKALEGGAAEVELGQLAEQKSASGDVKRFAQKMVQDHTRLGERMKPIAQHLGVREPKGPSKKDKELIARLEGLAGPQFDEVYIRAMVKDHKEDLKEFKSEAQMAQNPDLKQAAQQGAEVISQHLQIIERIAQGHNVANEDKSKASMGK